ncbi:MAG: UDP-N-acetylmuramoyl-L-alanine--D-glutamate ligase, partial [Alphaproteobacteria bacterium]
IDTRLCRGMEKAVAAAARDAARDKQGGAVVLLSPACASFDQYAHFAARGDHFKACVAGLGRARGAA